MPDFHAIITRQLALVDATKASERHTVYERIKEVLHKTIERAQDQSQLLDHVYELNRVIDEIERGFTQAPSRFDQLLKPIRDLSIQAKLKFGAIAWLIATVADFVTPLLELTVPIMIGSAIAGVVLLLSSGMIRKTRPLLQGGAFLCALLFVFSSGWWGLQHVVRDADANGALAEIMPGASAIQNAFLSRLGRIEAETRRVGDLLEEQTRRSAEEAREEAAMKEKYEREEREEKDRARQRIEIAGYKPDAVGLVTAYKDGSGLTGNFELLGIEPNETAIRTVAETARTKDEMRQLVSIIENHSGRLPAIQRLGQAIATDGKKLAAAFREANAKATVCDPRSYSLLIGPDLLKTTCSLNGRRFANAFQHYFNAIYGSNLSSLDFMRKAVSSLPIVKVTGTIWPGEIKDCSYYEGELDYFHIGGLFAWGTTATRNSGKIAYVWSEDPQFGEGSQKRCPMVDVQTGRARFCRARVVVASACEGNDLDNQSIRIIKNLASVR